MAAPFFSGALARTARAAVFAIPADVGDEQREGDGGEPPRKQVLVILFVDHCEQEHDRCAEEQQRFRAKLDVHGSPFPGDIRELRAPGRDPFRSQPALRSWSSSGSNGILKVRTASSPMTTLSPCSSIFRRSRVSGMSPGSRSVSKALTFISPIGTWTLGRRMPCTRLSRAQNSFHVTASGPPSSKRRPATSSRPTASAKY